MKKNNKKKKKKNNNELTKREIEVLSYFQYSMDDHEIGDELCISHHTVHTHRKHIYEKLDAHKDLEAVMNGLAKGYIEIKPKE